MLQRSVNTFVSRSRRSICSSRPIWAKKALGNAVPRTAELDEADLSGIPAVLQRSANILCGLSERTTTQKVLQVWAESGSEDDKTFCYFLGSSSVFDVSGIVIDKSQEEIDALKDSAHYNEVAVLPEDGKLPPQLFRKNSFPYTVAISPTSDTAALRPSLCLDYTADDGYVIYGLKEPVWDEMGIIDELMDLASSGQGEILSIQVIEGFNLALLRKT